VEAAVSVAPDRVEATLAKLWDEQAARGVLVHARTVNLVAVCNDPAALPHVQRVLGRLMPAHPGRSIVAAAYPSEQSAIAVDVALVADPRQTHACGELLTLDARGAARAWLPTVVERLLAPGARVYLWWLGDLPDNDTLYDRLTECADAVLVNSAEMDLRDLATLSALREWSQGAYSLADLNWVRLRPWQELLARFFDDPAVVPELARARTLALSFAPHEGEHPDEPASPQAGLFAGWLLGRLSAKTHEARWRRGAAGAPSEVSVPLAEGGELRVSFEAKARPGVLPGALLQVELETEGGACFEVGRSEDDPLVLGWQGDCRGAVVCPAVTRIALPEDAALLARLLDSPLRDPLFEASLTAIARTIAPLYPDRGGDGA
jgi:hypothetical protein